MDFLNLAFSFPTAVFSTLLLIVIIFWLISLLGFADVDMFETDIEIETDTEIADAGSSDSFMQMAFGGVPITVSLSLVIMLGWLVNIYLHQFFAYLLGDGIAFYIIGFAMLCGSLIAALPLTVLFIRPLRRFFTSKESVSKSDLLGMECTVVTGKVTQTFGQARLMIQGTEQLIEVRTELGEDFSQGDTAVLIEHDHDTHSYLITAKPW